VSVSCQPTETDTEAVNKTYLRLLPRKRAPFYCIYHLVYLWASVYCSLKLLLLCRKDKAIMPALRKSPCGPLGSRSGPRYIYSSNQKGCSNHALSKNKAIMSALRKSSWASGCSNYTLSKNNANVMSTLRISSPCGPSGLGLFKTIHFSFNLGRTSLVSGTRKRLAVIR
jgi:hypothetical protein